MSILNIGWGMIIVALPVVVLRLHGSAALVGTLLAIEGGIGIPAALIAGRLRTEGRERQIMAATSVIMGLAVLTMLVPSIAVIALGIAIVGAADGPSNISMFSLRQRRTNRAWYGRAFAVSMSLNFAGVPIGSAVAGTLLGVSIPLTIVLSAALAVGAGVLMLVMIPAAAPRPA